MSNWIFDMLKRNKVNKTASDTDKDTEWKKKINSSEWVQGVMSLKDEDEVKTPEVEKEAAYEMGDTEEETLKNDYDRDVHALSDYVLAEMLAEYTWQGKGVPENYSEAKEDMKSKVSKNRGSAEKDLLKLVGEHTKIDWKKTFEKYSDYEHKPAEAKDLYKPEFKPAGKQNWDKKVDYKSPSDSERTKGMEGVGRNEKERTDVTKQASNDSDDLIKWIVDSLKHIAPEDRTQFEKQLVNKDVIQKALLKYKGAFKTKEADCGSCEVPSPKKESAAVTEEAQDFISKHIAKHIKEDGMKQDQATAAAYSEARAKGYDVPENPKKSEQSKDKQEIESKVSKKDVLKKIAEIESPWKVIKDAEGQDVIARVSSEDEEDEEEKDPNKEGVEQK